ncbi:DUF1289 domain-containing protein [Pseudoalteromonas sp. McH1-7]|uniref:DUF1289 domain-containing protein n=1 Tax=Pseudoalteromonas TaxID=53246 RepID=UPI001590E29F|nr:MULTISPECIES: DUF1289 domain-containing protein [Pseudoalteromonas]MDW7548903.1 DUF1289 domain-containing protein [Pseudoalteromonas peptidolytica]NUZ11133.1 DUF1289 domain-containing protein [Pseudoalteromonas sp. McH1-7]USD30393.1 DUF1289 domain-containing protein [Pseudoalteromonas sp. SCSIO 43201]
MANLNDYFIHSPCVRQCCLDDNDVCVGCFRTLQEITSWSRFSEDEKREVIVNCTKRMHTSETKTHHPSKR